MLFDDAVLVGKVKKCNSSKGDVLISFTDATVIDDDSRTLILELNGLKVPFRIDSCVRKGSDGLYVHLAEVRNERDAELIVGANVFCPAECIDDEDSSDVPSLGYFIGFKVYDKREGLLGTVTGVDDSSINMLLYIKGEREIIIPFSEDFLVNFNPRKRTLRLDLPEGLTNIN